MDRGDFLREIEYNRNAAVEYARKWALGRNPDYYDFEELGGDCTNFASQCIFAGARVMNYTPTLGWYYRSTYDRAPAWSGVEYLHNFLVNNRSIGPFGRVASRSDVKIGDIVQLGNAVGFYHCPVITAILPRILVAAHSYDALDIPLSSYSFERVRFIHIDGVRIY